MENKNNRELLPVANGASAHQPPATTGQPLTLSRWHALDEQLRSPLQDYLRVISNRKWIILLAFITVLAAAAIRDFRMAPVYQATGRLAVNPRLQVNLTEGKTAAEELPTAYQEEQYLQTQLQILRGRELAKRVIEELKLERHPDYADLATLPDREKEIKLIDRFLSNLEVSLLRNTRVVTIAFQSHDPELAAQVANTIMDRYVQRALESRSHYTSQAREWLQERLAELRKNLEKAQGEMVSFSRENELVQLGEDQTIAIDQLSDLTKRLAEAQSERLEAEIKYQMSKDADPDTLPALLNNPVVQDLTKQAFDLKQELAELSSTYQPDFPPVAKVKEKLAEVENQLAQIKKRVLRGIEADYRAALRRENELRKMLEAKRAETLQKNESALTLGVKRREVQVASKVYESLLDKFNDVGLLSQLTMTNIEPLEAATIPVSPIKPRWMVDMALAALVGLMLGIGFAFVAEYLDNSVKTTDDVERLLAVPTLTVVPALKLSSRKRSHTAKLATGEWGSATNAILITDREKKWGSFAEAVRSLRTSLLLSRIDNPPHTLAFLSSLPGEGKTTLAVNTALALAQTGANVLLVDADLRHPELHEIFGIRSRPGLVDLIAGDTSIPSKGSTVSRAHAADAATEQTQRRNDAIDARDAMEAITPYKEVPTLKLLPCGTIPPNPSELLSSDRMRQLVKRLQQQFDFVIFDCAPTMTSDGLIMGTMADGVVFVINSGTTPKGVVHRSRQSLAELNVPILGVALNRFQAEKDGYYGYYGKYYGEGKEPSQRSEK